MALFPSVISTFTNPTATSKLNSPSHSGIESAQNNELVQIEAVLGVAGASSVLGTIITDLRSPGSTGGGHVQAANVGGTGQTSYNKGDLLVASSSSVLSKLAVGADGYAVVADSTQSSGVSYQGVATAKNIQNQSYSYIRASVMSASVYGITPSPVVSMLTDGQAFAVKWPTTNTTSVLALTVGASGPSSVTALLKNRDGTRPIVGAVLANAINIVEFDSVSSVFQIQGNYLPPYGASITSFLRNDATWAAPAGPSYKTATTTHTTNVTGSQTIAHGLGKTPSFIAISCRCAGAGGVGAISDGSFDGTTTAMVYWGDNGGTTKTSGNSSSDIIRIDTQNTATNYATATVAVDATNITLTWSNTGTPTALTINMKWEAYA